MNRSQRRRLASNKKGGTQMNHPTFGLKLHAEQLDRQRVTKLNTREEE